ncbi:MAG: fibronectin type III domain-containing protein, partial [Bacillota bacterium]|nr:fibronectin type III domain-containing protein [Bacillota bacterium]
MVNKRFISVVLVLVFFFACSGMVFADMVLDPTIVIKEPTAGEKLMADSDYTIKWYVERAGFYQLSYSVDNGATWSSINSTAIKLGHFETGSYFWKVPATPSSKVLIRASDMPIFGGNIYYNNSDVFSIIGVITVPKLPGPITLPPAAPSNLTATRDLPASVELTWTDNSSNESSFVVHRTTRSSSYKEIGTTAADVTTFTDTTAEYGVSYFYKVKATNAAGDSDFTEEKLGSLLFVPEQNAPEAPTNLKATALSSTEVRLTWTDQAADEDGFYVERDGARIVTLASDASSFTDTGLIPGTEYEYRVQAFNSSGASVYSNTSVITTPVTGVTPPPAAAETIVMHFYIDNPDYFINGALNTMDAAP